MNETRKASTTAAARKIFVNLPVKAHGFMYGHGFQDLDGHIWELMWMDPGASQPHGGTV